MRKGMFSYLFAVCYAITSPLLSQITIDLNSTNTHLEIVGRPDDNQHGFALATGDVNNDSVTDLIIGAPGLTSGLDRKEGRVFVFFGSTGLSGRIDLSTESADLEIIGSQLHAGLGSSVAAMDLNGDQIDDIVMSQPGADTDAGVQVGSISIVFGKPTLSGIMTVLDADVTIEGESALDFFGEALASGDLNNDNIADLIVGVPVAGTSGRANSGKAYVLFGRSNWPQSINLASSAPNILVLGRSNTQFIANSVASGDLNNDGWDDLIIGNFKANSAAAIDAGKTFVFFGSDSLSANIDLVVDTPEVTIIGGKEQDHLGITVKSRDFDNDGISDLIVGARRVDSDLVNDVGAVFIFRGRGSWPEVIEMATDTADFTIVGGVNAINIGASIDLVESYNGTGTALLLGSPFSSPLNRLNSGSAFVMNSNSFSFKETIDTDLSGISVLGATEQDSLGYSVAAGDLNGDGSDDVILGAPGAGQGGIVYVLFDDMPSHVSVADNSAAISPDEFILHQNYPNPFNGGTRLLLEIPASVDRFEVVLYNMLGQKVTTLFSGAAQDRHRILHWNGHDDSGNDVPSGVFLVAVVADGVTRTYKKIIHSK